MSRDDPRLVRLSILVARTVRAQGCHWTAAGAQRCSCGLHALAQDVRDDLAHAITVAEVDGLRADQAERDLAACQAHAREIAAQRDRVASLVAERERLAAGLPAGDAGLLAQVRAMTEPGVMAQAGRVLDDVRAEGSRDVEGSR